jgi:hypothetical protein
MPTFTTDIAAAQQDYRGLQKRPDAAKVTGKYGILESVYTSTGAEAAGDIIDIGAIPEGAVVIPEESAITCEAMGGTGTAVATVGDSADADRYSATAVALTSAARTALTPALATSIITRTPVTAETATIKAVLALTSGAVTAAKKIVFTIKFRHP